MTRQEYYNLLAAAVADGTLPSRKGGRPTCRYRGDGGTRCAIGLLIPDAEYQEGMENRTVDALREKFPTSVTQVEEMSATEYHLIQAAHDESIYNDLSKGGRASWSGTLFLTKVKLALNL